MRNPQQLSTTLSENFLFLLAFSPLVCSEQRQNILAQLKRKMREFKTQLGEEPKMKEGWRDNIRKEREWEKRFLEEQKKKKLEKEQREKEEAEALARGLYSEFAFFAWETAIVNK